MKKLLGLLVVFVSTFSFSQGWNYIGSSTGISNATEVDIEITPNGILYAAYIDASNSNKITVRKWNAASSSWQLVGAAGIGDANVFDLQLIVLGETTPVVAAKTFYQTTYEFLEIYRFNGTSWVYQAIGSGGYNQIEHSYDYSLRGNASNQLFLTFFNVDDQSTGYFPDNALITVNMTTQTLYGGASPNLEQTSFSGELSSFIDGANAYVIHGEADMSDYIPLDVSTNGAAYNGYTLDNSDGASKMLIEKNNGATAYSSVWSVPNGTYPLKFRSFNGTTFGTQASVSVGTNVADFDFDTYYNDAYVFYKAGSCYFNKVTNVASPAISTISFGPTLAPSTATSLETEVYGSVYVIAYVDGGKFYVKEYNQLANIEDYDIFAMCESSVFNNSASNSVYCLDPNFSQQGLTMTCVSQNVSVIPNSAISISGAGTLNFSLNISNTNDVSSPTIVDLQFELFDNGVSCGTQLIPITVNPKPVITFTNPTNAVCENANPINLNNWANPSGGTWAGTGITNNTFYPSYPTGSSLVMAYTKTNQYGCTSAGTLPFTINQTPDLTVTTGSSNCNQNTGTASVTITNGQSPYAIYWSTGSTLSSVSDLAPGQYIVSVTDDNGCLSTATSMIGSNGLTQTGVSTGALCYGTNNGAINVTVTGGAAPLVYSWSNGATTEDIAGCAGGPYELTITDALGCVSTASYTVQEPQQIMLDQMTVTQPACSSTNGQVTASFNGGTAPFNYAWFNSGANLGVNNATITNIGAGTYTCIVTDANGCSLNAYALVSNNFGPTLAIDTIIPSSCSNDGQIQLTVISGNPTDYLWTNGATTQNITNLSPGNYSVSVTGASGCITVLGGTVESTLPDPIDICLVTVDSTTNTNLVVWEKPITTGIDHFNIYRETSQAGLYQLVAAVAYSDESIYNDLVASPNVRSWRYKISSVDACGTESELSLSHKTIHLVISHGLGSDINLFWDSYEGFNYSNFILRRHTDANGWTTIQTMPNNLFTYTDQPSTTDGLFYEVTVAAPSLCSTTKMAQDFNTTRSNRDNRLSTGQPNSVSEMLNQVVNIYPNPVTTVLNIDNNSSQLIEARILDQTGRLISSATLVPGQTKIDCGKLAMGMYNIELHSSGAKTLKRFVIER